MEKVIKKIKKVFTWLWEHIYLIISIIGSFLLILFVSREYIEKKKIKKRNWKEIPGNKTQVLLKNKKGKWDKINLPIIKNKQITTDDIESIGQTEKEGEYAIRRKHTPKTRRDIVSTDNNISMDI